MPDLSLSSWPLEIMINLTLSMKDCQRMKHWKHDINFGCLAEHSNFNAYSWQQSSFFPFFFVSLCCFTIDTSYTSNFLCNFLLSFHWIVLLKEFNTFVFLSMVKGRKANSRTINCFV